MIEIFYLIGTFCIVKIKLKNDREYKYIDLIGTFCIVKNHSPNIIEPS